MNRNRRFRGGLVGGVGLAVLLLGLAPANAKPASHSAPQHKPAAFGIGAANPKGFDGRAYLNFLISPGGAGTDHIAIVNLARRKQRIGVYAVDTSTATDGTLSFSPRVDKPLDAGSWIRVITPSGRPYVYVPPRAKVVLPIEVKVPSNAQPGDHAAGIVASVASTVVGKGGTSSRVPLEQRVALRTFFRVSGPLGPRLEVQGMHIGHPTSWNPFTGFTTTVSYTVRNTGNVRLGAGQRVSVSGMFGEKSSSAPLVPVLLPGGTAQYTVRVSGVYPQLNMTVRVSLRPIAVPGDADPTLPTSYDTTHAFWAIPWALFIVVVLVLIVLVLLIRRRLRRKPGRHAPQSKKIREEQPA